MSDKQALSSDLMRIGEYIYSGRDELADAFLKRDKELYRNLSVSIGVTPLQKWLDLIKERIGGSKQAAERALTAAVILSA